MVWLYNCVECNGWFDNIEKPCVESYRVYFVGNTKIDPSMSCIFALIVRATCCLGKEIEMNDFQIILRHTYKGDQ